MALEGCQSTLPCSRQHPPSAFQRSDMPRQGHPAGPKAACCPRTAALFVGDSLRNKKPRMAERVGFHPLVHQTLPSTNQRIRAENISSGTSPTSRRWLGLSQEPVLSQQHREEQLGQIYSTTFVACNSPTHLQCHFSNFQQSEQLHIPHYGFEEFLKQMLFYRYVEYSKQKGSLSRRITADKKKRELNFLCCIHWCSCAIFLLPHVCCCCEIEY